VSIALHKKPRHSYGASPAIRNHTYLQPDTGEHPLP